MNFFFHYIGEKIKIKILTNMEAFYFILFFCQKNWEKTAVQYWDNSTSWYCSGWTESSQLAKIPHDISENHRRQLTCFCFKLRLIHRILTNIKRETLPKYHLKKSSFRWGWNFLHIPKKGIKAHSGRRIFLEPLFINP